MEKIKLVNPSAEHELQAKEFIQELIDYNSKIAGSGGLDGQIDNYQDWLKSENDFRKGINLPEGYVPGSTYFAIREADNKIVGMVNIRHQLSDFLLEQGGHIGDCVRPTERRKGFATEILYLALEKCDELGIRHALVVCDKTNIGSAKQIQNNFGILENELEVDGRIIQRYWIDVKYAIENNKLKRSAKAL